MTDKRRNNGKTGLLFPLFFYFISIYVAGKLLCGFALFPINTKSYRTLFFVLLGQLRISSNFTFCCQVRKESFIPDMLMISLP